MQTLLVQSESLLFLFLFRKHLNMCNLGTAHCDSLPTNRNIVFPMLQAVSVVLGLPFLEPYRPILSPRKAAECRILTLGQSIVVISLRPIRKDIVQRPSVVVLTNVTNCFLVQYILQSSFSPLNATVLMFLIQLVIFLVIQLILSKLN